jgi:hypothetical protein
LRSLSSNELRSVGCGCIAIPCEPDFDDHVWKENSRLLPRLPFTTETVQYFLSITPKVLSIATVSGKPRN